MPSTPQITFTVRHDGYALLTLEKLARGKPQSANGRKAGGIMVPPIRTRFFQNQAGSAPNQTQPGQQSDIDRTWYQFFAQLAARAQASGGSDLSAIAFLCPSIDEEDILLYGTGALDATTNPATFTPTLNLESRYGITFNVGDWIVWNNSNGYEIDRITAMQDGKWTVQRGEFQSAIAAQGDVNFYRLEPKVFTVDLPDGQLPKLLQFPWANKCVAAIRSWGFGAAGPGPEYTLNLAQASLIPPCPGWRTMNGAEYTSIGISGDLVVGQMAAFRCPVAAWESIRCVFGTVKTPPTGDIGVGETVAGLIVSVLYIAPIGRYGAAVEADRAVGYLGKLVIAPGQYQSWSIRPDGRQMPYDLAYPPNVLGGVSTLALLAPPAEPSLTGGTVLFEPDGEIDLMVAQIGTATPGANLLITVQT